jgi:nucleoside-diphosphate kinase
MERTLIIVKPDAVQRGLSGQIITRFEQRGLRIIGMKFMKVSRELAAAHYAVHEGKPFYEPLVNFITSSPVIVMALEGPNAIVAARTTIGATKCYEAAAGTIRGDFGMETGRNLVHGSDSVENGEKEIALWFTDDELVDWEQANKPWILE